MPRFLSLALALCLGTLPAWAGADKDILKIEGKLSEDDARDVLVKKSPHKVHEIKLVKDKVYVIDLKSTDFHSVLRLESSESQQLALNFNRDKKDSRLFFKPKADDNYRLIATNADAKAGAYTLTVRPGTEEELARSDPFFEMIGKPAPDLVSAFSFNGKTAKLSDLKGNVVLLDFWAVWCGPCIATFPQLRDWEKEFKKEGLEIVGATTYYEVYGFDKGKLKRVGKLNPETKKNEGGLTPEQEHEMLKDFVAHHKLSHRMITLTGDDWNASRGEYRRTGIPHVVLIDRKGIVRMVRVGSGEANARALEEEIRRLVAEK